MKNASFLYLYSCSSAVVLCSVPIDFNSLKTPYLELHKNTSNKSFLLGTFINHFSEQWLLSTGQAEQAGQAGLVGRVERREGKRKRMGKGKKGSHQKADKGHSAVRMR